ncbi:putative cytidine and deoxycytidylate deaminase [Pseudomonas phage vB_PsyM_KIL3b]|uniref:Putative cytidine and deoxycytidylate deaminase n=3 Tax=Pseudomonas phage vB_PsyM_KIL1 TaxID=1777065 RepID=A0A142IFT9_9CAUD|nr:dCMP deaminase [Pseudomonas phage vB_PsyM_KIL1]AMR57276.1 putative cytidine and deoxycytidylate deaminase [Pseudomonas phage vB_PsyM_KIL1]AMR57596.1 putative cytidine and deoxycytidylate deaminase [Pseudomonas phage vB_PsyM_KIL3]AMR58094.1 putative cytidine and deoxycytidylate deaminase [Pseudomonas phage vB_PsyM_KIL3b]
MGVKNRYDQMHMATAEAYANESHCPRTHVGCALVLASGIVSGGFNGHASGGPNQWEFSPDGNPEVVHAELNSLGKCLEQGLSTKGATMYVTLSPCLECSKLLVRAGVKRVVYRDKYRKVDGINYLLKYNVVVERLAFSDWGSIPYLARWEGVDERGRHLERVVQEDKV